MNAWRGAAPWVAIGVLTAAGCGSSSSSNGAFSASPPVASGPADNGASSGSSSGPTGSASGGFGNSGTPALPPETKSENSFRAPVATGNIVWSANPTSGRGGVIDAPTRNVKTTGAGKGPTYRAAHADPKKPTHDEAIVIKLISEDATLLRVHQGKLSTQTFASTADANSWAISPLGRWAIAWTDATAVSNPDPTQGFQQIAVIDLSLSRSTPLAVGFRPVQLAFSADETHAFAVTDDGISVIDLTAPSGPATTRQDPLSAMNLPVAEAGPPDAAPPVSDAATGDAQAAEADASSPSDAAAVLDTGAPTGDDDASASASTAPDVSFTPDGAYALIRRDGLAAITIDSLVDGTLTTIPLPTAPTDLTVSPRGDFALAVLRDTSTVAVLPIPGVIGNPALVTTIAITGETVGRAIVTNQGKSALLFTTAAPIDRLTVLTMQPPSFRTITLHAPVQAVFPTSDGANAIVLHQVTDTSATVKGAFSIVPIAEDLSALIEALPAAPTAVALSPANDRAIISIRDDTSATYGLYMALMPSQQVLTYPLASPPISVGIAAGAGRGYAAQDYSEGRITFVDLSEGGVPDGGAGFTARTISGFELNAGVVVGGSGQ